MLPTMRSRTRLALNLLTLALVVTLPENAAAAPAPVPMNVQTAQAAPTRPGTVAVAVANLREGSAVRHRFDLSRHGDLAEFSRRLLSNRKTLPDVVLVQEVLGSARDVAKSLSRHPRARRKNVDYRVAVQPRRTVRRGSCDGGRRGRYTALRDSAVLVNTKTVRKIHSRGVVRTWGRWSRAGRAQVGNAGYGCAEHPWVRASVRHRGTKARVVRLLSAHVAPTGTRLKNKAVQHLVHRMGLMRRAAPRDLAVIGGDLNLARCAYRAMRPERAGCAVRPAHRRLERAGFRDAVRARNLTGPRGVVGVQRRIDFIYTTGRVPASSFDRCYLAHLVKVNRCGPRRAVFTREPHFRGCQQRALFGASNVACPRPLQRRYYSDHPLLRASLR